MSSLISNDIGRFQVLEPQGKKIMTFSFDRALLLDPVKANKANEKELNKFKKFECFTENYSTPDFSEGKDIKMYPVYPFRWKIDSVTGDQLEMSGRLAINGKNEDVPDHEKATHTASQENVNLIKAAFMAYLKENGLLSTFYCNSFDGQIWSTNLDDWKNLVRILEKRFGPLSTVCPSKGHIGINTIFYDDGSFSTNQRGFLVKVLKSVDPHGKLVKVDTSSLILLVPI